MTTPAATLWNPRVIIPFVIVTLIWGSTWIVIRDQLGIVPASWSVTWRFAVATLAMAVMAALSKDGLRIGARGQLFAAILGSAQFVLNFNLVYRAEHYLTSGLVAVMFALLIVPNTLLSRLFLGTPLNRRLLLGGGIAVVGVILLLAHEAAGISAAPHQAALGAALAFGGVLCASVANVMQASATGRSLPVFALFAWAMLWGMLINALFALAVAGPPAIDWRGGYIAGVLYLGLFGSALTFPLYFHIIRAVGAGPAAWTGVLVPIIAMGLSTLLEGYRWSMLSVLGATLAITGLVVTIWPARRQPVAAT